MRQFLSSSWNERSSFNEAAAYYSTIAYNDQMRISSEREIAVVLAITIKDMRHAWYSVLA